MNIALACDHTGFEQLKELSKYLKSLGHDCINFGPKNLKPEDDYPDYVKPAAEAVAGGKCERGIIIGGTGQGEAMAANRLKGIRCVVFYGPAVPRKVIDAEGRTSHDPYSIIKLSRQHNNSNMLSLAARFESLEDMKKIVELWLAAPFSGEPRHIRRIEKMDGGG